MKRSPDSFNAGLQYLRDYESQRKKQGFVQGKTNEYLEALELKFIKIAMVVADDPKELEYLINEVNTRFKDALEFKDCPTLMPESSGNIAYMFEPPPEYEADNVVLKKLGRAWLEGGIERLNNFNLNDEFTKEELIAFEDELPEIWEDFTNWQCMTEKIVQFFIDHVEYHKMVTIIP